MRAAQRPETEDARLEELRSYDILDSSPEPGYDDLTAIAAQIFGVPTALISLVDSERQWFKSCHGLDAAETPRELAFCAHAILRPTETLVVPNALADVRFHDNPLVTDDPAIRFYAGAPLVTPRGHSLGTLCVIAPEVREPTPAQLDALSALARQVVTQLELRRAGKVARTAQQEAEQANRAKDEFLATMSHELRTPMNAVVGCAELLHDSQLAPVQKEHVDLILDASEVLLAVIDDILDLRKIEEGKLLLETGVVSFEDVAAKVMAVLGPRARAAGLTLRVELPEDLPSLKADGMRVKQVLLNLVGNAIKFTGSGEVVVAASHADGRVTVGVRDTGTGVAADRVPLLFERFRQADAGVARRHGGSGLGLAICKNLVEMMGGQIGCQSEVGRGSEFWFELPAAEHLKATDQATAEDSAAGGRDVSGMKVLVVEDNEINQMIVQRILRKLGCAVTVASTGERGLSEAITGVFDVVLMDRHLPGGDGVETTRAILEAMGDASPPILALTATGTRSDREACLAAGMCGFLTKPIRAKRLEEALAAVPPRTAAAS